MAQPTLVPSSEAADDELRFVARQTLFFLLSDGGPSYKSQCLRHNLDEISQWPVLDCQHYHDPREWDPYLVGDTRVYPSHEEAEYTAVLAFAIAVSASWWLVKPSCGSPGCQLSFAMDVGTTG